MQQKLKEMHRLTLAEGQAKAIKLVYDAEAEGIKRLVNAGIDDGV